MGDTMKPMGDTKSQPLHNTTDPEGDEIHEQNNQDPFGDELSEQFDDKNPIGPQGDEIREKPSPLPTSPTPD